MGVAMNGNQNQQLIEAILSGEKELLDYIADDGEWIIPGINSYKGKQEIIERLLQPLAQQMKSMGRKTVTNIMSDGDRVVVESFAQDRFTVENKPYNNTYCVVYQFYNNRIQRITEYCDTALVKETFGELVNT